MSSNHQIGISQAQIDEIELRLLGADFRPWALSRPGVYDTNGKRFISKSSRKDVKLAMRYSQRFVPHTAEQAAELKSLNMDPDDTPQFSSVALQRELCLFNMAPSTTEDMANFVVHAPEDIELLLKQVKLMRERYRQCEIEREEFKKEALSARVERSALQEKLTSLRAVLRELGLAIKASGGA